MHTGCVVAQNSVVTKEVPPYAVVAGNPARIRKYRFDESTIKRLLNLKWWQYHFSDFKGIDLTRDINFYLDCLEERIAKGQINPFNPAKMFFQELIARSKHHKIVNVGNVKAQTKQPQILVQQASIKNSMVQVRDSALSRIHSHLAYKLGSAMILNSKSLWGYIRMPYVLSYIKESHRIEQQKYQESILKNPKLKLPKLESYPDYKEAIKEKQCFTYKLGAALMQADKDWFKGGYLRFYFKEVPRLKREFRGERNPHLSL